MVWHFGPFRLDQANAELWRAEQAVLLRPKTFALLVYLVTHAGQLVTKEALLDALWPETAVGEGVLKTSMNDLRKALGETAKAPQWIATVHGRGYRFVAPVTLGESTVLAAVPTTHPTLLPAPVPGPALPLASVSTAPPAPRLVAREAEVATLHQWWANALQGERRLGFLTGEAGMGKTTLVDAFVAQIAGQAPLWIGHGQCIEHYGAGEAYLPLLDALGQMGRSPDGPQLVALLRQHAPSWLLQLPALLSPQDAEALQRYVGETTRARMLRELAEVLEVLTAVRPWILVLEDLHWSDTATIEWLAYVGRRRGPARLLVLGTYRPVEAVVRAHPVRAMVHELTGHGAGTELPLGTWSEAGVAAYLTQRGDGGEVPAALVRVLTERTDGHPLFVVALVDELLRQGQLQHEPDGWTLAGGLDTVTVGVPPSMRSLLERQMAQLPHTAQELLVAASVAGVEFTVAAVAAGVQHTEDDVEAQCDALAHQQHVVQAHGTVVWPDGTVTGCYRFRHALYQELLYERIPVHRRMRWHQQIGLRLEAGYGPQAPEMAAELAMHFGRGQDAQRTVVYLRHAGEHALRYSAHHEAVGYFEQALGALQALPAIRATHELAIDLRLDLRAALIPLGAFGRILAHLGEAETLALTLDDPWRLGRVICYLANCYSQMGDYARALEFGQRALAQSMALADFALQVQTRYFLGQTYYALGDYRQAIEVVQWNVASIGHERHHERFGLPTLAAVASRAVLVKSLAAVGAFAAGRVRGAEAVQIAEACDHAHSCFLAYLRVGGLYLQQGAWPQALALLERSLVHWQVFTLQPWFPPIASALGHARVLAGHFAEATPLLDQACEQVLSKHTTFERGLSMAWLSEALLVTGRRDDARTVARLALEHACTQQERGDEAWALRLLGEITVHGAPPTVDEAESYYRRALVLAHELGMRPLQAHCHRGLGSLYGTMGRWEQARAEISTAIELYEAMQMTFWRLQAEAGLAPRAGR